MRIVFTIKNLSPLVLLLVSAVFAACSSSNGAKPDSEKPGTTDAGTTAGSTDAGGMTDSATTDSGASDSGATDGGTSGGAVIAGAAPVGVMQGAWESNCALQTDSLGTPYVKQTLNVNAEIMNSELGYYSDANCTVAQSVGIAISGSTVQFVTTTVPTGELVTTPQGVAEAVDFHSKTVSIDNVPLTDAEKNLPGFAPVIGYTIILVLDDVMYFGDSSNPETDESSPAKRSNTIDFTTGFNRVQ